MEVLAFIRVVPTAALLLGFRPNPLNGRIPPMGAKPDDRTTQLSLGDLLYADTARYRVPEKEWLVLVQAIAAGDQLALHQLYERTHRIVFTLAARITNSRETAEEVTIDVFYDVWRKASSYDPVNGTVVGWIMNQARSRAIDRLRFENRKKRVNASLESPPISPENIDPHRTCELEEQGRILVAALAHLSAEERRAIETAFFSELTYQETAARLNQPLGTLKTRIRSGLGKLRQALAGKLGAQ